MSARGSAGDSAPPPASASIIPARCGAAGPKSVASRIPVQPGWGRGGRKRSGPVYPGSGRKTTRCCGSVTLVGAAVISAPASPPEN